MIVTAGETVYWVFCLLEASSDMGTTVATAVCIAYKPVQLVAKVGETCRCKRQQHSA